jgi:hypothetical protein
LSFDTGLAHRAAAVFHAKPTWLRFLESRRLIDADVRRKVLPLHAKLAKFWEWYTEDPTLDRQSQAWPAYAAKGPIGGQHES